MDNTAMLWQQSWSLQAKRSSGESAERSAHDFAAWLRRRIGHFITALHALPLALLRARCC